LIQKVKPFKFDIANVSLIGLRGS